MPRKPKGPPTERELRKGIEIARGCANLALNEYFDEPTPANWASLGMFIGGFNSNYAKLTALLAEQATKE